MKKVVRSVWICALSGLAFLTACTVQNGLTRKERKQLMKERKQLEMQLSKVKSDEMENPPEDDPNFYRCFWEEYTAHYQEKYALENKLDSINFRLGEDIDLDRNFRRRQILQRIDSLNLLVKSYIPACIYGSPEMMEERAGRIEESDIEIWERQLEEANKELLEFDISGLPVRRAEGRAADVLYGSPDLGRRVKK